MDLMRVAACFAYAIGWFSKKQQRHSDNIDGTHYIYSKLWGYVFL